MRPANRVRLICCCMPALVFGCAPVPSNMSPVSLESDPYVLSYKDPAFARTYATFSVFPSSLVFDNAAVSGILERQMLFALRNSIEQRGYRFVEITSSPDFLITIDGSSPYRETYVPPRTVTIPQWEPGRIKTTYDHTYGSFQYNLYGDYSAYGYGTYSGSSTSYRI